MMDADGTVAVIPRDQRGQRMRVPGGDSGPQCSHSPVCGRKGGAARGQLARVEYDQNMGYKFSYPYTVPKGIGGLPSVALDSKGYLWAFKRSPAGVVQLMKFAPDHKLVLEVPESVIGHQDKAHGMAVDKDDNVWITDNGRATVMKLSPEGKLLMTLGEKGKRGDWVEEKGQHLLWQPVMVAFAPGGDLYIAEGHANESPNDVDSPDPANVEGVARVIHLTKDGKFVGHLFGNEVGQGKFDSTMVSPSIPATAMCGSATANSTASWSMYGGRPLREDPVVMRNPGSRPELRPCKGNPDGAGQDGQFLKLNRDGKVLGAVGNGMGVGNGQPTEASYWVFDRTRQSDCGRHQRRFASIRRGSEVADTFRW